MRKNTRAFTLIELLAVVLIIGILASIALPLYQRAVKRAKLSELTVILDPIKKNLDMYVFMNGYPNSTTWLSNPDTIDGFPLEMAITCEHNTWCTTKVGRIGFRCDMNSCEIRYHADPIFSSIQFWLIKPSGQEHWGVNHLSGGATDDVSIICNWLLDNNYPVQDNQGNTWNKCERVGVELGGKPEHPGNSGNGNGNGNGHGNG